MPDVFLTALRVLSCCVSHISRPDPADVEVLRDAVTEPELKQQLPDVLACYVIERELHHRRGASAAVVRQADPPDGIDRICRPE